MQDQKSISIIIPCRNEEKFIFQVLLNISKQDYPTDRMEVIVADGISDDKTVQEIKRFQQTFPELKVVLVENPEKTVPLL